MRTITINGTTVDPFLLARPSFADTSYVLVQTFAPLRAIERSWLERAGASLLEHVPVDTYVCRCASSDLGPLERLPFVAWVGPYAPGFKVPAGWVGRRGPTLADPPAVLADATRTIDVVLHRDADPAAAAHEIARIVGLNPSELSASGRKVRVVAPRHRLAALAALDDVRHLEEVVPAKLHGTRIRWVPVEAGEGSVDWTGAGQVVAIADTGFDLGSTTDVHPAFAGRVQRLYALGRATPDDPNGHGTHAAGSALGDHASPLGPMRGAAPGASLVVQAVLDSRGGLGGLPHDLSDLLGPPYRDDGARVHSNSWGSSRGDGRYDSQAFEVDQFVWEHRDLVVCFAAGNEGRDERGTGQPSAGSLTPPGTARNAITVGASESWRPEFALTYGDGWPDAFPAGPLRADRVADEPDGMAAFSSRGPTADGRIKPDLVAPGTCVLSAKSRASFATGWTPSADPLLLFLGGTSAATSEVAGCCALVREFLIARQGTPPSAALVKAALVNGASPLRGRSVPDFAGGFGRVDVAATVGARAADLALVIDEDRALDTGDEAVFDLELPEDAALKATLVWTDPPGEGLQNDLDLVVRAGGEERHGNVPAGSDAYDRVNNVEQVIWSAAPGGRASVVVRAHRAALWAQPFALVVRVSATERGRRARRAGGASRRGGRGP